MSFAISILAIGVLSIAALVSVAYLIHPPAYFVAQYGGDVTAARWTTPFIAGICLFFVLLIVSKTKNISPSALAKYKL
jgi:hypothetical protein